MLTESELDTLKTKREDTMLRYIMKEEKREHVRSEGLLQGMYANAYESKVVDTDRPLTHETIFNILATIDKDHEVVKAKIYLKAVDQSYLRRKHRRKIKDFKNSDDVIETNTLVCGGKVNLRTSVYAPRIYRDIVDSGMLRERGAGTFEDYGCVISAAELAKRFGGSIPSKDMHEKVVYLSDCGLVEYETYKPRYKRQTSKLKPYWYTKLELTDKGKEYMRIYLEMIEILIF